MREPSPTYVAYAIARHKKLDPHDTALDAVHHCMRYRGFTPRAARMGPGLADEVGDLPVPVIVDHTVFERYVYFEVPEGAR